MRVQRDDRREPLQQLQLRQVLQRAADPLPRPQQAGSGEDGDDPRRRPREAVSLRPRPHPARPMAGQEHDALRSRDQGGTHRSSAVQVADEETAASEAQAVQRRRDLPEEEVATQDQAPQAPRGSGERGRVPAGEGGRRGGRYHDNGRRGGPHAGRLERIVVNSCDVRCRFSG